LMKDEKKRKKMAEACKRIANPEASLRIAKKLLEISV